MVKGLKMKPFNSHIQVYLRPFPDIELNLEEYKNDALIIQVGIFDILQSKGEDEVNDITRKKL